MKIRYGKSGYWAFTVGITDGGMVGLFKVRFAVNFYKWYFEIVFGEKELRKFHL